MRVDKIEIKNFTSDKLLISDNGKITESGLFVSDLHKLLELSKKIFNREYCICCSDEDTELVKCDNIVTVQLPHEIIVDVVKVITNKGTCKIKINDVVIDSKTTYGFKTDKISVSISSTKDACGLKVWVIGRIV